MTDDEVIISHSLREFSKILGQVEDEMEVTVIEDAETKFITPLEKLRKDQIESVRKAKKDFDKQTQKFCGAQDRYVTLKKEESLAESAESVRLETCCFVVNLLLLPSSHENSSILRNPSCKVVRVVSH